MTNPDRDEQRALDAVDPDRAVALLVDLLAVPSISGSDAEIDIQHLLAKRMAELGLQADLWPMDLPALVGAPGYPGAESERSQGWGLVATSVASPAGDPTRWRSEAFTPTAVGHRIHGRGACDMKAGVAANRAAAAALAAAGFAPADPSRCTASSPRRTGGSGPLTPWPRGTPARPASSPSRPTAR